MFSPIFSKGGLVFSIDGLDLHFNPIDISVFGVMGLHWGPLNPREHSGKPVIVEITLPGPPPLTLKTRAYIICERTLYSESMGLKFQMDAENAATLEKYVSKHGFYPTEYVRKYPRIPSTSSIQTFPLHAIATPLDSEGTEEATTFDIANISPNGILLTTENRIVTIAPGKKFKFILDPRGWFPHAIQADGLVCRVAEDLNPDNGNWIRYIGVKFLRMDEVNRVAFMSLLKDILNKIRPMAKPG